MAKLGSYEKRKKAMKQRSQRFFWFLIVALLVHSALVPPAIHWLSEDATAKEKKPMQVRYSTLPKNANPQKAVKRELQKQKKLAKKEKKKEDEQKPLPSRGQIVDLPPPATPTEAPEDAEYLSENNTKVEKESVSRNQDKDYKNAAHERTRVRKELSDNDTEIVLRAPNRGPLHLSTNDQQKAEKSVLSLPAQKAKSQLKLSESLLGQFQNQSAQEALKGRGQSLSLNIDNPSEDSEDGASAPTQGERALQLMPSEGILAKIAGAPANDFLEDVPEGEGTFLNSREFKYAAYFNRLKRNISQHWQPATELRRRDPTGNVYGFRSRHTILEITLSREGAVEDVNVKHSSGLGFLDREAVAAIKRASPFPNPPDGLVEDGMIRFPFGFNLSMGRGGGFRLPF